MTSPISIGTPELVLVRYGELALKGGNRGSFEHALIRNIRAATEHISPVRIERARGRISVHPERRVLDVARRLQDVFGIKSLSPAWGCAPDVEAITGMSVALVEEALEDSPGAETVSFRVETTRADKSFPLRSMELDSHVGAALAARFPRLAVQLEEPELTLGIEVRPERTYVFVRRLPGLGGLPVTTLGRAMCLLSGGIDSPVAAWLAMKRGCSVSFVSFYSPPYIGEASKKKVSDLVRALSRFQPHNRLFVVPFTEIQTTIRETAPEAYRTVLYRRMMQRIASRVARRAKCRVLITGESIGQVASQTLENISCIEAAATMPVLRPLLTYDKEETIALARRIGTYKVSERSAPDCCTVFQPMNPIIHGRQDACEEAESRMKVEELVAAAVEGTERLDIECEW